MKEKKENALESEEQVKKEETFQISETWTTDTIEDIDDFIESQGIYLRQ